MPKQIARLLKTDVMADLDLPGIAQLLESKGRKGDTMLAHITPQEAALLKSRGGAGTMNPDTGLPEFYDGTEDTYFSPSRAGRASADAETYYRPSRQAVEAVPEPSYEEFPLSPYSFSPNTSPVTLAPPDQHIPLILTISQCLILVLSAAVVMIQPLMALLLKRWLLNSFR